MTTTPQDDSSGSFLLTLIAKLDKGVVPWRRTCNRTQFGNARNHFSGPVYTRINSFLLDGYDVPRFATFKQISDAGHRVRKGNGHARAGETREHHPGRPGQL